MSAERAPRPILRFQSGAGKPPAAMPPSGAPPAGQPAPTVRELAVQYIRERRAEQAAGNITSEVFRREKRILKRFARGRLGRTAGDRVRPSQVRIWLLAQVAWKSDHTRRDGASVIRGLFRWAVDEGHLQRDPIRALRPCWAPPQPRKAMAEAEYDALMRAARNCNGKVCRARSSRVRFRFQVWFLWNTGCRTCELREAKWSDVDWQLGLIVLAKHKTVRKTGKPRLIPLSRRVLRVLAWLKRKALPDQQHIFVAAGGRPLNKDSFARLFRRYANSAGLRKGAVAYALRHSWCVDGINLNLSDRKIANSMGHAGLQNIGWYGRGSAIDAANLTGTADAIDQGRRARQSPKKCRAPRPDQPGLFDDLQP